MRGHVRKRGNNWAVVIELPRDAASGRRKQKWIPVKGTKRDAERKLRDVLHTMDKGIYLEPNKVSLGEWLRQWLNDYVSIHTTDRTQESYSSIVERHLVPALGAIRLVELQPQHIQRYYAKALSEGRADGTGGLSARSVVYHHRILSKALDYAVKMNMVVRNVLSVVDPPRVARTQMATLNAEEVVKFLDAAKDTDYFVMFATLLYTGLRRGELLALKWRNLDLDKGSLIVTETAYKLGNGQYVIKEPKTAHSRRTVSLSPALIALLKEYRADQELLRIQLGLGLTDNDFVFIRHDGSPINPNAVTLAFKRVLKKAGLKNIRLHDLRHTHATLMLKAGEHPKIVSERLGHSNIGITLDTYSHVLPGLQEAAAERFDGTLEEGLLEDKSGDNVCKMFANNKGLSGRPYRSRTCDTLIKRQRSSVPLSPPHSQEVPSSLDPKSSFVPNGTESPSPSH
ncbi:tyrosine-type recombinase/integrase [Chloroflexota bacterium]